MYSTTLTCRFVRSPVFISLAIVMMCSVGDTIHGDEPVAKRRVVVIAHRGEHRAHPENTLPAIAAAVDIGCDYVEVDVRQTRDGELVLMHDGEVGRTTNGKGNVADLSLAEIKALEVNAPRDRFPEPVRVPTLDEALTAYADKIQLYLDHKRAPEDRVVDVLRQHDMIARTAVYGSPNDLARYRQHDASIRLMPSHPDNETDMRRIHERLGVGVFDGGIEDWTAEQVELSHSLGVEVWVDCLGGEDNPRGWRRAAAIGVDGIQTDRPAELIELLEELGLR